jgi:hypothetical protein
MSFKEWTAVVQVVGVVVICGWLVNDVMATGLATGGVAGVAMKLVWAIGGAIVFNIVGLIIVAILVSIAQGKELKDERADERDKAVAARSSRNGYALASSFAGLSLLALAFGADPILAVYALFAAPLLGGATDAVSRLVYYRIG